MGSIHLALLCVAFIACHAVNKENFKTCKTSSFCTRQREYDQSSNVYRILPQSVELTDYGFKAQLHNQVGDQALEVSINYLAFSTFRVTVDVVGEGHRRYRLPVGDVLRVDPKPYPMKTERKSGGVILFGGLNEKAVINFDPFTVDFLSDNRVVAQLNRRNLFNFESSSSHLERKVEVLSEQNASTVTDAPSSSSEEEVENPELIKPDTSDPPSEHFNDSNIEESSESTTATPDSASESVNHEEQQETPSESETSPESPGDVPKEDPYPWTEYFKGHRDRRPFGPSSISLDVDFPGFLHAYGIPEHADSLVLKPTDKGDPYRLYNLDVFEYELNSPMALYGAVPLIWALNRNHTVGLFWHNPSETWVDVQYSEHPTDGFLSKLPRLFSKPESFVKTRWMSESGVLDAFIILGHVPADVARAYAHLTGTTPLPPLFSLGYHQCRWNYNDEDDVLTVDREFDAHKIPVDVIWLDIEHTNGKRYFTWDHSKFPSPHEMVEKLLLKGRKLVTVIDPHIKRDSSWQVYSDALNNDVFVKTHDGQVFDGWCWPGSSSWPDFINPTVRKWWASMFTQYEPKQANGVYTWNDMGEPSVFNGPEVTMHKDAVHYQGWEHRDVHNIYGLYIHQATWEGQLLRSGGTERPFVLTRAFFAGSQRTSAVWTGDNAADWGHLEVSIPMVLSLSIGGITFSGADVGGFFGNPDHELLTRWYQAAAYQPFFRAHAHMDTKRREPWLVPEPYLEAIRNAVVARYQLLPYWYTMFARAEADGQPVMAPMWYHFRESEKTYGMELQYMIGEAILVRPVTRQGAASVDVYFPPGTWYHHPSLQTFSGDLTVSFPVDLNSIPVFCRGGWIIPRRERVRRSSWKMRDDPFTLYVYMDPTRYEAIGYLYIDDYHSISRDSARFFRIQYEATRDPVISGPAGGRLRLDRIPIPGTTVLPERDSPNSSLLPQIERIVFVGLQHEIDRVTVIEKSGSRRSVEFTQDPDTFTADKKYFGSIRSGVLVVRQPLVRVSNDWEMHLVTGTESKADL